MQLGKGLEPVNYTLSRVFARPITRQRFNFSQGKSVLESFSEYSLPLCFLGNPNGRLPNPVIIKTYMKLIEKLKWFFGSTADAKRVRRIASIGLLIALFIGLFWVVPVDKVVYALLTADPLYLFLGLVFAFISLFLSAAEHMPLIRAQGIQRTLGELFSINMATKFYSLFAPGTIVPSGIRWYRISQPEGKGAEGLAVVAFFRLLENFLNIAMGVGFWLLSGQKRFQVNIWWILGFILITVVLWIFITRWSLPIYHWFKRHTSRLEGMPYWRGILRLTEKFLLAVSAYADMPAMQLFLAVFYGVVSQLAIIVSNVFMAQAVGIHLTFMEMGWINSVIIWATQLPFAFAGGLGIREVTLVAILGTFGISAERALAFSFLLFVRGIVLSLMGGVSEFYQTLHLKRSEKAYQVPRKTKEI